MTVMTKEQIQAWLRGEPGILEAKSQMEKHAPDIARTALALHQQLADAEAAQALLVERAAEIADGYHQRAIEWAKKVRGLDQHIDETDSSRIAKDIRALASPSGVEELTKLRARADEAEKTLAYCEKQWADTDRITHAKMLSERTHAEKAEAERDALRARLSEMEGQVGSLREAMKPFDTVGGELFAKNWNAGDLVFDGGPMRSDCLFFEDFLNLRAALAAAGGDA